MATKSIPAVPAKVERTCDSCGVMQTNCCWWNRITCPVFDMYDQAWAESTIDLCKNCSRLAWDYLLAEQQKAKDSVPEQQR